MNDKGSISAISRGWRRRQSLKEHLLDSDRTATSARSAEENAVQPSPTPRVPGRATKLVIRTPISIRTQKSQIEPVYFVQKPCREERHLIVKWRINAVSEIIRVERLRESVWGRISIAHTVRSETSKLGLSLLAWERQHYYQGEYHKQNLGYS
jgi:hypothetical protein